MTKLKYFLTVLFTLLGLAATMVISNNFVGGDVGSFFGGSYPEFISIISPFLPIVGFFIAGLLLMKKGLKPAITTIVITLCSLLVSGLLLALLTKLGSSILAVFTMLFMIMYSLIISPVFGLINSLNPSEYGTVFAFLIVLMYPASAILGALVGKNLAKRNACE